MHSEKMSKSVKTIQVCIFVASKNYHCKATSLYMFFSKLNLQTQQILDSTLYFSNLNLKTHKILESKAAH